MTKEFEPFILEIKWTYEDIKSLRPDWSDEKCDEVLGDLAGTIEDISIERGWEVIESSIHEYDDEEYEEEEEEEDA